MPKDQFVIDNSQWTIKKNNFQLSIFNCQFSTGFTLIELLVVLTIIAILTAIGFVAYIDFSKKGRDAKRQADLAGIQSALQQYNLDQSYYPVNGLGCSVGTLKIDCAFQSMDGTKTYLSKIPKDPLTSQDQYCYLPSTSSGSACDNSPSARCTSYKLYAKLEKPPSGSPTYSCGGNATYNLQATPP